MTLIDTHTHLFSSQFDKDRDQVITAAIKAGVSRMYLPNIDVETLQPMLDLHDSYPEHCFPMAGLHPCDVDSNFQGQIDKIYDWILNHRDVCFGIGETGLDYHWDTSFVNEQKQSLYTHAQWAKELDLPIILHTRESFSDTLQIMQEEQDGSLRGIFHCFTGNLEQANQVIDLGFMLGIGGVITFKNSGAELREVIKEIDLKHIVLETDAPYLAPTPYRGKRNGSSYLPLIAQQIAEIKEIDFDEVAQVTTQSARSMFSSTTN